MCGGAFQCSSLQQCVYQDQLSRLREPSSRRHWQYSRLHHAAVCRHFVRTNISLVLMRCRRIIYCVAVRLSYPDKCRRFVERALHKHPSSIALRVLAAHCSLLTRNYVQASREYLKAYTESQQTDERQRESGVVCLYTGIALLLRSLSPSVKNRHSYVLHAISFFSSYAQRCNGKIHADYNLARAFHTLGVRHMAQFFYNRVLVHAAGAR